MESSDLDKKEKELLREQAELKKKLAKATKAADKLRAAMAGTTPASPSPTKPEDSSKAKKTFPQKEIVTEKTERGEKNEEVTDFISEFDLGPILPAEFEALDELQKLKVIRDLKRRIVDIVKSDAHTQYSEELKEKSLKGKIWSSVVKEKDLKNLEKKVFEELKNTPEGKKLISEDLEMLTRMTERKDIRLAEDGSVYISYLNPAGLENPTPEKIEAVNEFNIKANAYANMPYEWGQEKKGAAFKMEREDKKGLKIKIGSTNRAEYEIAKTEYEKARDEVLKIKADGKNLENKGQAILEILEINNAVQMEQLLNTHPEFEKALDDFGRSASGKEMVKTAGNFFQTITGGKNLTNKLLTAGGFGARMLARGAAVFTGATMCTALGAPIIGGTIGYWRGKIRGKETLQERQKQARQGQEDKSKEAVNMVDAENLNKRLEEMIEARISTLTNPEEEVKRIDQLKRRIEYTQSKIESGLVNFGDSKTALTNQYNLINNLNRALVLTPTLEGTTRKDIDERLNGFLVFKTRNITEAQNEFIKKQAMRGMYMGAGFATAGYALRWAGEHFGWWGHHGAETVSQKGLTESTVPRNHGAGHDVLSKSEPLPKTISVPEAPVAVESVHENIINPDAVVHKGQGIEHVFIKQIENNSKLAQELGFKGDINDKAALHAFADREAHVVAREAGYVDDAGHEVRITEADKVAFELKAENGHGIVIERTVDGKLLGEYAEKEGYEFGKNPDNQFEREIDTSHHESVTNTTPDTETASGIPTLEENLHAPAAIDSEDDVPWINTPGDTTEGPATADELRAKIAEQLDTAKEPPALDHAGSENIITQTPHTSAFTHFANNPFNLSGTKLIQAFDASQRNIKFLFEEKPIYLMNVGAKELIHADLANSDPEPARLGECLRQLEFFSRLKPKGSGWFEIGKTETVEEYMARAFQKLVKNGGLKLFEESMRDIKK